MFQTTNQILNGVFIHCLILSIKNVYYVQPKPVVKSSTAGWRKLGTRTRLSMMKSALSESLTPCDSKAGRGRGGVKEETIEKHGDFTNKHRD